MKHRWLVALAVSLVLPTAAWAHKPSDSYLDLVVDSSVAQLRWDIALRDLDSALDLDRDGDGELTWREVRERQAEIDAYTASRLTISRGNESCVALQRKPAAIDRRSDGAYLVLSQDFKCPGAGDLAIAYRLFADIDPTHRGILRLTASGVARTVVLDPNQPQQSFKLSSNAHWRESLGEFGSFVREGVHHIGLGYDHLAFLIALLLPAALMRTSTASASSWVPVPSMRVAFIGAVKIVTAFTVAHTITLALATLEIVDPSSRGIEMAIAATVILAALNNVVPIATRRAWMVAFAFGLVHGFGLASGLREAGHSGAPLAVALLGFNLGVEIGQLAVVGVALPIFFALRNQRAYARGGMQFASVGLALFGGIWLWERAKGTVILGF